jgi:hypothetical protein
MPAKFPWHRHWRSPCPLPRRSLSGSARCERARRGHRELLPAARAFAAAERIRSPTVMTSLGDRATLAVANLRAVRVLQVLNKWNRPRLRYSGTGSLVGQLRDLLALDLDARHESLLTPDEDHERLLQTGGRDLPGRAEIRHREVQARADLEALGVLERLQRLGRGEEVGQRECPGRGRMRLLFRVAASVPYAVG